MGTHERFIGFLIEHFGGAFPTWLAPVQVQILPVAEPHIEFANKLREELFAAGVRVKVDNSGDSLGKRIRVAEMMIVPYMLVIGDKEIAGGELAVRSYKTKEQKVISKEQFVSDLLEEIKGRKL